MPTQTDSNKRAPAAAAIELLRENSMAMLAQRELERRIVSGEIAVGAKLNEVDIANALGVSRGPVREAFRALDQAGLVRVEKNRGVFVRQLSLEEASEIYEVRAALEGLIGRLAAQRIDADELEQLRAIVRKMAALSSKSGSTTLLEPPRGAGRAGPALGAQVATVWRTARSQRLISSCTRSRAIVGRKRRSTCHCAASSSRFL
jgi:DNA-binding GntR family transcriptional regulator